MKRLQLNVLVILCAATLAACSGGSTEYVPYGQVDNTPKLDMKAAIYRAVLPSGNSLTITADQPSAGAVYGAYTIKNNVGTLISSGVVSETDTQLKLIGHKRKPLCSDEAFTVSVDSKTINSSRDEAYITLSGDKLCSGTLPITTPILISKTTTASMYSRGIVGENQELALSLISADNINFVGSITLNNLSLPSPAKATLIGTITTQDPNTSFPADPDIGDVVAINDPLAYGFLFNRVTNFSGHFFAATDSISKITGKVRTTTTAPHYMNEIRVTVDDNFIPQSELLVSNPTDRVGYNPL